MRARRPLLAALAACAGLTPACGDFPDVSTVLDLRVLAVNNEPSEMVLTVTGRPSQPGARIDPAALGIDPASIPTVTLTPLIADPPALAQGRSLTWSLQACPNDPYGPAPSGGAGMNAADPSGGARTTVGSTLCDGARTVWDLGRDFPVGQSVDVALTADQLLAAFKADVYVDQYGNPHGGFDLGMPLNLQLTVTDGVQTTRAVKRLLFWAQALPGQTPNQTPHIPSVSVYRDRDEATWAPVGPVTVLEPGTPAAVALGSGLWLRPEFVPDPVEACRGVVPCSCDAFPPAAGPGGTAERCWATTVIDPGTHLAVPARVPRERIRYAFYATAGHFAPPRTVSELLPGVSGTVHLESKYVPPATLDEVPPEPVTGQRLVTLWIVVRDERGGESWVQRQLALEPAGP